MVASNNEVPAKDGIPNLSKRSATATLMQPFRTATISQFQGRLLLVERITKAQSNHRYVEWSIPDSRTVEVVYHASYDPYRTTSFVFRPKAVGGTHAIKWMSAKDASKTVIINVYEWQAHNERRLWRSPRPLNEKSPRIP